MNITIVLWTLAVQLFGTFRLLIARRPRVARGS